MIALGLSQGEEDGIVSAQPAIEALPTWAQILVTILVGLATLGIAFKGYLSKDRPSVVPHHERNNVEISREMCARLRELVEELERQGKDQRAWDQRDEKRR
jgi:Tfp pilus assembly protein PilO